jgi:hypothetical protein
LLGEISWRKKRLSRYDGRPAVLEEAFPRSTKWKPSLKLAADYTNRAAAGRVKRLSRMRWSKISKPSAPLGPEDRDDGAEHDQEQTHWYLQAQLSSSIIP